MQDEAHESEKHDAQVEFEKAKELFAEGKYRPALALLDELDRRFPRTLNLMYARALCLAELDRTDEALDLCDAITVLFDDPRAGELKTRLTGADEDTGPLPGMAPEEVYPDAAAWPAHPAKRRIGPWVVALVLVAALLLVPALLLGVMSEGTPEQDGAEAPSDAPEPAEASAPPVSEENAQADETVVSALSETAATDPHEITLVGARAWLESGHFAGCAAELEEILQAQPDHSGALQLADELAAARQAFLAKHSGPAADTHVECLDDPAQSYELYVPASARVDTGAMILYAFSPGGNGLDTLRGFSPIADRLGWIVAASNNSKNGPWEGIFEAQDAVLRDTEERLILHPSLRFAAGFSGGARASLALAFRYPDKICGVLAMGAGWPVNTELQPQTPALDVCILIGNQDSNIRHDIPNTEQKLRAAGITPLTTVYPGGHVGPPIELVAQACDWLHTRALQRAEAR